MTTNKQTNEDNEQFPVNEDEIGAAQNEDVEPEDTETGNQTPDEETAPDAGEMLAALKVELEREKAVSAEYLRRLQNLQADYDNFRKRTQREKEELAKYAAEKLIKDLLPVLDNLDRAFAASSKTEDFASLAKGVEMIQRQLCTILEKEGLCPIQCVGEEFDPSKHEAVMHVESEEHDSNTVVEELQKGYLLKEKILRPSMVKVSR